MSDEYLFSGGRNLVRIDHDADLSALRQNGFLDSDSCSHLRRASWRQLISKSRHGLQVDGILGPRSFAIIQEGAESHVSCIDHPDQKEAFILYPSTAFSTRQSVKKVSVDVNHRAELVLAKLQNRPRPPILPLKPSQRRS